MRLIDADKMAVDESEAYMSAQVQITGDLKWLVNFAAHSKIQRLIADTPTVDAVPVVRCLECKFGSWDSEPDDAMVCVRTNDGFWRSGNDFCSRGERKEGANNG